MMMFLHALEKRKIKLFMNHDEDGMEMFFIKYIPVETEFDVGINSEEKDTGQEDKNGENTPQQSSRFKSISAKPKKKKVDKTHVKKRKESNKSKAKRKEKYVVDDEFHSNNSDDDFEFFLGSDYEKSSDSGAFNEWVGYFSSDGVKEFDHNLTPNNTSPGIEDITTEFDAETETEIDVEPDVAAEIDADTVEIPAKTTEIQPETVFFEPETDAQIAAETAEIEPETAETDVEIVEVTAEMAAETDAQIADKTAEIVEVSAEMAAETAEIVEVGAEMAAETAETDAQIADKTAEMAAGTAEIGPETAETDAQIADKTAEMAAATAEIEPETADPVTEKPTGTAEIAEMPTETAEIAETSEMPPEPSATPILDTSANKTTESLPKVDIFFGEPVEVGEQSDSCNSDRDFYKENDSSDDESIRKKAGEKYPRFNPEKDMADSQFVIGLLFTHKKELLAAIKEHLMKWGKDIEVTHNDNIRVIAKCHGLNCEWELYAKKVGTQGLFQIRTIVSEHICPEGQNTKKATASYIAKRYLNLFRTDHQISCVDLKNKVQEELNADISLNKVYKVRAIAKKLIEGKYKDQYALLRNYEEELKLSNPGTTVKIASDMDLNIGEDVFLRIYVCLKAVKDGFIAGCRRIVGLDGTFLKGSHKGILISAVGVDANDGIYPTAFALVESENLSSWSWFIKLIKDDLQIDKPSDWCIISDRQKGLIPAVVKELPGVEHRFCARHLHNNMKRLYPGDELKEKFWKCAKSTYGNEFERSMEELKLLNEQAFMWLNTTTNPNNWSRAYFRVSSKCDILLNNHSEVFNKCILAARNKPILAILERVRVYIMLRLQSRRAWIAKQKGDICPKIGKKIGETKETSQIMLSGIPCPHAIAAISKEGFLPENFVDQAYTVSCYKKAYEPVLNPANGPNNWPRSNKPPLVAPSKLRIFGRPQTKRKYSLNNNAGQEEQPAIPVQPNKRQKVARNAMWVAKCSGCGQIDHNSRGCPNRQEGLEVGDDFYHHTSNNCGRFMTVGHNSRTCPTLPPRNYAPENDDFGDVQNRSMQADQQPESSQDVNPSANQFSDASQPQQAKKRARKPAKCSSCHQEGHNKATCRNPQPNPLLGLKRNGMFWND